MWERTTMANRFEQGFMHIPDDIRMQQLGDWQIGVSAHVVELDPKTVAHEAEIIQDWSKAEMHEPTWVQETHGVPSLIARIDGTLGMDEETRADRLVYEVEHRPGWIGLSNILNTDFNTAFSEVKETWPEGLQVVRTDQSKTLDDHLWIGENNIANPDTTAEHVLVRMEPNSDGTDSLVKRSVAPVQTKGNKQYGVDMGLWTPVENGEHLEELLENGGHQVFKPDGSKLDGVRAVLQSGQPVSLPGERVITNRTRGAATKGNMRKTYGDGERQYYAQNTASSYARVRVIAL